jgi:hypothetical protein
MTRRTLKGQLVKRILRGIVDRIREIHMTDFTDETRTVQIIVLIYLLFRSMFSDQIPRLELFSTSLTSLATNVRRDWLEICLHLRIASDAVELISIGEKQRAIKRRLTLITAETSRMEDAFAIGQRNLFDDLQTMETHWG